jgi:ketosteroid isomerase-like protein
METKDIVKNAWMAFGSRDPARIEAAFTPDAIWYAPRGNATAVAIGHPDAHELDRAFIVNFMSREFATLFVADVQSTPRGLVAEGNTAVLETTFTAQLANGRRYENDYCFVIETKDGRIHRMREYMDTLRGHRQIFGEG